MPIEPRDILKTFFETGDIPTQDQFYDVLDSYIHKTDDGVTIYKVSDDEIYFGIHNTAPQAALGITAMGADDAVAAFNRSGDDTATWFINLNPGASGNKGFNIDQALESGHTSRLFISETGGAVGIGTTTPSEQLHVQSNAGAGATALKLLNTATVINQGFGIAHEQNSTDTDIDGSFSIFENDFTQANKRMVIRAGGNVGVNELIPTTRLQVSRDVADAGSDVDLVVGSGIVTFGPITDNLVFDYRGVQARHGEYVGTEVDLTAAALNLQRVGGDILIHGDDAIDVTSQAIITTGASLGLGTITPAERVDIDGAIRIGTTVNTNEGTVRYSGSDFEGYMGGEWVSFTKNNKADLWNKVNKNTISYIGKEKTMVGIGTDAPGAVLSVEDKTATDVNEASVTIHNIATTTNKQPLLRTGLAVVVENTWENKGYSVGLYVAKVSGSPGNNLNLAAALNGNVVIGDIGEGSKFSLRNESKNVLAIQVGQAPAPSGDIKDNVLVYSQYGDNGFPVFHTMNGDGNTVALYKAEGLTIEDDSPISPDTYDSAVAAVIERMRERIDQLESRLMKFGLLADPVPAP